MSKIPKTISMILILGLLSLLPVITIQVAPEITLKVMDLNKNPVPNAVVFQDWQHWSYESEEHIDKATSDANGLVNFDKKSITVSTFKFFSGKFGETFVKIIPTHASVGPSTLR